MVDKTIDEIRDMVGAVSKTDMYTSPNIYLTKKAEKIKHIFTDESKDLTYSKVPEAITVLYEGESKLIELTVPEPSKLEKLLNEGFKDKKYKTAIERKKDVRKAIYHYLFGPHSVSTDSRYLMGVIDKLYDIKIKSVFTKGKKRLRNLAIKEIEEKHPDFLKDERISRYVYEIVVHPKEDLTKGADVYNEKLEIMREMDEENFDEDFIKEAKKIHDFYNKQIERPDYRYYEKRKEMHAHMADTLMEEIKQAIEEVKEWEQKQMPGILKAKEHNAELIEQLRNDIKQLKRTCDMSKSFKIYHFEFEPITDVEINGAKDFDKILKFWCKWDGERDKIMVEYPKKFKCGEFDAVTGYNSTKASVAKRTEFLKINFNMYKEHRWIEDVAISLFINRIENENKRKYEIWQANGIWTNMNAGDFIHMQQYFDDDIKIIKEIKVGG